MDRESWLAERKTGLGSSDAAAVCGMSEWGSPLHVYLDKCGLLPNRDTEPMRWGRLLEQVVAQAYTDLTGRETLLPPHPLYRLAEYPWMLASPDRLAFKRVVELKTSRTAEGWGEEGTDEVPPGYLLQVQHQMMVLGLEVADVCVLIGGQDARVYTVPARPDIQQMLLSIEGELWGRIQRREPPEPDWTHKDTPRLLDLLHRPGEEAAPLDRADLVDAYIRLGTYARACDEERERVKARIVEAMGTAGLGLLRDGRRVRRQVRTRAAYEVTESVYVDFRILKAR